MVEHCVIIVFHHVECHDRREVRALSGEGGGGRGGNLQEGNTSTYKKHNGTLSVCNLVPHQSCTLQKMSGSGWIGVPCVALCILFNTIEVTVTIGGCW